MTQAQADAVRDLRVIAVSDAYQLAPWADAMASQDVAWWRAHPEAKQFAGRKFSTHLIDGVERIVPGRISNATNSGLLAMEVAKLLGATRILLLGIDMQGSHYFGPHEHGLKNTTPARFEAMKRQFESWKAEGVEVINCNPASGLRCFPMARLEEVL